jgi:homopolymeric O-antigen transport system permease protein
MSFVALGKSLRRNRHLIVQLSKREVVGRRPLSHGLGLVDFQSPVYAGGVYLRLTEILKSRWGGVGGDDSKTQSAVVLIAGMIVLTLFNEIINRASGLILSDVNYIKKDASRCISLSVLRGCWPSLAYSCAMWGNPSSSLPPC